MSDGLVLKPTIRHISNDLLTREQLISGRLSIDEKVRPPDAIV